MPPHSPWGDVRETLRGLIPKVRPKESRKFLDRMLKKHAEALEGVVKAYTRKVEKHTPIHPEYVASVLDEEADDDAVFTVDTGMCNVWAARYLTSNGRRGVIGSFHKGPALVGIVTDPNALSMPPKISAEMVSGFALSAGKMVLDGGVGRMLQMARSNLRNIPRPSGMSRNPWRAHGLRDSLEGLWGRGPPPYPNGPSTVKRRS